MLLGVKMKEVCVPVWVFSLNVAAGGNSQNCFQYSWLLNCCDNLVSCFCFSQGSQSILPMPLSSGKSFDTTEKEEEGVDQKREGKKISRSRYLESTWPLWVDRAPLSYSQHTLQRHPAMVPACLLQGAHTTVIPAPSSSALQPQLAAENCSGTRMPAPSARAPLTAAPASSTLQRHPSAAPGFPLQSAQQHLRAALCSDTTAAPQRYQHPCSKALKPLWQRDPRPLCPFFFDNFTNFSGTRPVLSTISQIPHFGGVKMWKVLETPYGMAGSTWIIDRAFARTAVTTSATNVMTYLQMVAGKKNTSKRTAHCKPTLCPWCEKLPRQQHGKNISLRGKNADFTFVFAVCRSFRATGSHLDFKCNFTQVFAVWPSNSHVATHSCVRHKEGSSGQSKFEFHNTFARPTRAISEDVRPTRAIFADGRRSKFAFKHAFVRPPCMIPAGHGSCYSSVPARATITNFACCGQK